MNCLSENILLFVLQIVVINIHDTDVTYVHLSPTNQLHQSF